MNKALRHKLATFVAIVLLCNFSLVAQEIGNPTTPPSPSDDIDDEAPVPIDGFVWVSLLAGGIYGLKRFSKTPKA